MQNPRLTFGLIAANGLAAAPTHATTGCTQTLRPIVLSRGLFGFDVVGSAEHLFGVASDLHRDGATTVCSTQQLDSYRGEAHGGQLQAEPRHLKAVSSPLSFNPVGHSHGGAAPPSASQRSRPSWWLSTAPGPTA